MGPCLDVLHKTQRTLFKTSPLLTATKVLPSKPRFLTSTSESLGSNTLLQPSLTCMTNFTGELKFHIETSCVCRF